VISHENHQKYNYGTGLMYKSARVHVSLRAEDVDRIRLLLDLECYRIQDQSPFAFDEPTSWASAIRNLRDYFIWLQDSNLSTASSDSQSNSTPTP
jgi:hypothetical protein